MVNILEEGSNGLANLNYSSLLKNINNVLENQEIQNLFTLSEDKKRLLIDVDKIAYQIAEKNIENPLESSNYSAKSATVNFSKGLANDFVNQVQQIRDNLKQHLQKTLEASNENISIEDYVKFFATELSRFQGKNSNQLSLNYPFDNKYSNLQKQRLSLHKEGSNNSPLLSFNKLTITVENINQFEQQLKESLSNFIELKFASETEEDRENLQDILDDLVSDKNRNNDFYRLIRLMKEEALGKLQREAKVRYLEFLKEHIGEHPDIIYLEDLIRRLRLIEDYINDPLKEDGHYEVNYADITVNYRDIFNRADAFDILPIIPIIVGYLGEINDEVNGKKQCIFGLKMKLAGKVQTAGGEPSFDYYLNFLNTESQEHKEGLKESFKKKFFVEKVFKIAFLYYFIFASNDSSAENYQPESDLEYNPISTFEEKVLPFFKESDENKKKSILRGIKRGLESYGIDQKLEKLKKLITGFLKKTRTEALPTRNYPIHISVTQGILEQDYSTIDDSNSFFKNVLQNKQKDALKYISIDSSNADNNSLCTLPATISISDIQYFTTEDSQSFSMEYDLRNVYTIPIILVPQEKRCQNLSKTLVSQQNAKQDNQNSEVQSNPENVIEFTYNYQRLKTEIFTEKENSKTFVYQITFALLAYVSLKVLLDSSKRRLFIPILRLHLTDKNNPSPEEVFMRSIFYVISHLINEIHRSNCQGYCIKNINSFKTNNALNSLYSRVPKIFKINNNSDTCKLNKLAIIIISSRESDRSKDDYKIANLYGEVIGINLQPDNSIRLYTISTFSGNYDSREIHTHPDVIIDEVNKLYQQGYRDILYIAKSPYSTTLNMTETDKDEELYFMSPSTIRSLKNNREDLKIYPIFYDKYYVVKLKTPQVNSLYIQDTVELTHLVKDPHKKSIVFFNLFNGIEISKNTYYNGVISYATLLNFYEGILDDTDIHTGLIDDSQLKHDLLQYLTLYHFSQYEKSATKNQNISLKLDPYQNIIGDKSIGKLSIIKHIGGRVNFNSLAFLTEVRKALNVQPEIEELPSETNSI